MKCEQWMSLLPMYPDAVSDPETASAMRMHAEECPHCAKALAEHECLLSGLRALDDGLCVPDTFAEGWRAAVRAEAKGSRASRRLPRWQGWTVAVAAALMLFSGAALLQGGRMTTPGLDRHTMYSEGMGYGASDEDRGQMMPKAAPADFAMAGAGEDLGNMDQAQEQMVRQSASVSLDTAAYDADIARIEALLTESGGWSEYRYASGEPLDQNPEAGGRYAHMTLRVPAEALDAFVESLGCIGKLRSSERSAQDISESYYDTRARLEIAEAQRDRLTLLLEQAITITDIMDIEAYLSELQYTIESLTGRLNNWDALVAHALVQVTVQEVSDKALSEGGETLWQRASEGLSRSLVGGRELLANVFIFLVMATPYIFTGAAVALLVVLILWAHKKHVNKRR